MNKTLVTKVPALLDFDGSGIPHRTVVGRGGAGWTVFTFDSATEAADFVSTYGMASMPCWKRFEIIEGQLWCVR